MSLKNKHIKNALVLVFLSLIISSCSTKKKAWTNRQYHNTLAKYNGYFNGNESLKTGVKKLHSNHTEDYTVILPVFPIKNLKKEKKVHTYMDKAIKKGSIVIQRHSIKIKGTEYCKWIDDNYLMVGKSYFYKGEFKEAIKTFNFIKNEYTEKQTRFYASLWLIRGYVQIGDFKSAELELEELKKDKKITSKSEKDLTMVAADFYLQKQDYTNGTNELLKTTSLIKRKRKKVRLNYILAQIYQNSKNYTLAQKHYKLVLRSNPEYELAFNAKMNLARSFEEENSKAIKMKENLLKMTKDDKNKEYLDQIYFTIAEMEINNKDTVEAIKNYTLSTINSVENNSQKALSFLALGKIYYNQAEYRLAKTNYDSSLFYMQGDFRLYKETKERHLILIDLVFNLELIETQDSLQVLAGLSRSQQNAIINEIIQAEIDKERREAEEKKLRQQMIYESGINERLGQQFGNKTGGGKWYFYNPATLSFGMSEFRKKWGKRKLEDDWRRKDKKISNSFDLDSLATDSITLETENKKNPNYYLNQLPKTKEDFAASDSKIKEALYQLGVIYKEKLNKIKLSSESFMSIYTRFSFDKQYAALALYNVYINNMETSNLNAEKTKNLILSNYPNSIYAKMLLDPNYKEEVFTKKDLQELKYQELFKLYNENMYDQVIEKTNTISKDIYTNKSLLLRGLSFIKNQDYDSAIKTLKEISEEEEGVFQEAQYILEVIKDPSKMNKSNETALAGSPYLYRPNNEHMLILVLPKKETDITYLKTLVSEFHSTSIGNEVFEISALLLGLDKHLLMIKPFKNMQESLDYYELFIEEIKIMNQLNKTQKSIMTISLENFKEFYTNKDVEGYNEFFIKNYLITD
tara:strand:+ start:5376 stop:7958 length:2583 start_codon:yes stop_codon:yes gene_type:complete